MENYTVNTVENPDHHVQWSAFRSSSEKETIRIWILSQQISGLEHNSLLIWHPCFHHGLGGPQWPLMNSQSPELNPIVDLVHRKDEPQIQPPMT